MAKRILIMGSFDTKAEELTFLRERVAGLDFEAVCMDTSMGRESAVKVEIGSNEVSTAAGPQRLEAAGRMGIPQVLTPCGFDMLSCGPIERRDRGDALWTSRDLASRKLFMPDALRVEVRPSEEEGALIADTVADKLLAAKGDWRFLIPLKGWSSVSEKGAPLFDPTADEAFVRRLKERLDGDRNLRTLDFALNTEEFGNIAAETLLSMIGLPTGIERAEGIGMVQRQSRKKP